MFVMLWRDSGAVTNVPPPASASGTRSWSARNGPIGAWDARYARASRAARSATASAGSPASPKPVNTSVTCSLSIEMITAFPGPGAPTGPPGTAGRLAFSTSTSASS